MSPQLQLVGQHLPHHLPYLQVSAALHQNGEFESII